MKEDQDTQSRVESSKQALQERYNLQGLPFFGRAVCLRKFFKPIHLVKHQCTRVTRDVMPCKRFVVPAASFEENAAPGKPFERPLCSSCVSNAARWNRRTVLGTRAIGLCWNLSLII